MLPPQGAVPQQQAQGGVPAAPQPPQGAAPQAKAQGQTKLSPEDEAILRKDPDVKKTIDTFIGKDVPMDKVPDFFLAEVAGMVHKLGVQGAVAMLTKMIPADVKKQMTDEVPDSAPQAPAPVPQGA